MFSGFNQTGIVFAVTYRSRIWQRQSFSNFLTHNCYFRHKHPTNVEIFYMDTSDFFRSYISVDNNFNQATLMEVKPVRKTDISTKPPIDTMPYVPLVLAPTSFMIVWALIVFSVSALCKNAQDKDRIVTYNCCNELPCRDCRFFNNNSHLKCAVHPSTALTEQAINCSDYWPQQ